MDGSNIECVDVSFDGSIANPSGLCINPSGHLPTEVTPRTSMLDQKVHTNGVAHVPKADSMSSAAMICSVVRWVNTSLCLPSLESNCNILSLPPLIWRE